MLERLVDKFMRGTKKAEAAETSGYLSGCLNRICPNFALRYTEAMQDNRANADQDALDVLADLVMEEIGHSGGDGAAARAYLYILIENEHLPYSERLSVNELNTLSDLLFCYFNGSSDVNEKGNLVLSLIENKFSNGQFSQARILLQIFDTNQETKQNNERNLYYEEMIMRLDAQSQRIRCSNVGTAQVKADGESSDTDAMTALNAFESATGAGFYLYLRDPHEYESWCSALHELDESVQQYLLDYIPVISWHRFCEIDEPIRTQLSRHMTFEMLRRHVLQKIRMCYFILLASGSTNYEWFIFSFTEWSRKHFDVDVREVFPFLHRSGIVDNMSLQESLDITLERFYGPAMNKVCIQPETLSKAYADALSFVFSSDLSKVPAGCYNFGDFLLDQLLPFDYEDPMFAYRLHSMM